MTDEQQPLSARPNKTARKRELAELQRLAEQMSALSNQQLESLGVEESLIEALAELRDMPKSGARNRFLKYCVKHMDEDGLEQVKLFLSDRKSQQVAVNQAFHRVEQWRDRLIEEGDEALQALIGEYPSVDRQQLRSLWRDAVREHSGGKPAGAGRKLFRFLRELILQGRA